MDKFEELTNLIETAKHNLSIISNGEVPGEKYVAMRGVDQIPVGGESISGQPDDRPEEKPASVEDRRI